MEQFVTYSFEIKAFFLKSSRRSDVLPSMSIFKSNSSVDFVCSVGLLSEDFCVLSCSFIGLSDFASYLNISNENLYSNRKAYTSLDVVPSTSVRVLAIHPSVVSTLGIQLVFITFVNLSSNSTFSFSFSGGTLN